jgi:hypothetical protein
MNLRKAYFILAVFSTIAAAQSMIFPRWPEASKISSEKLSRFKSSIMSNGQVLDSSLIRDGHSDFNISHAPIVSLKLDSNSDLLLTNVQVRDRNNFGISYITDSIKSLKLNPSATSNNQPPFFLSERTPSGTTFQTCFVSGNSMPANFGVNQDQMSVAVDQVDSLKKNLGVMRFLGLTPSRRYQCMLITLKTRLPSQEGYQLWRDLLGKLQLSFK